MTKWLGLAGLLIVGGLTIYIFALRAEHATALSAEQQKTRDVQGRFDAYKLAIEQSISDAARQKAQEALVLLDRQKALEAENARLRASYAEASRERDQASAQLLRILNDAPQTTESALDAGTRAYYGSLRERQVQGLAR